MISRVSLLVITILLLAAPASTQDGGGFLTFESADGTDVVLLSYPASDDRVARLKWCDGTSVSIPVADPVTGTLRVAIPSEFQERGEGLLKVRSESSGPFLIDRDAVLLIKDQGRWVVASASDGAAVNFPPKGWTIAVDEAPAPEPGDTPGPIDDEGDTPQDPSAATPSEIARDKVSTGLIRLADEEGLSASEAQSLAALLSRETGSSLAHPDSPNPVLNSLLDQHDDLAILKDIDLRATTFENDGQTSLGIVFAYKKSRPLRVEEFGASRVHGLAFDVDIDGRYAFEEDLNPADFLRARVTFDYFSSHGGSKGSLSNDQQQRATKMAKSLTNLSGSEIFTSDAWTELQALASETIGTQFYWEAGLDAGYETNQTFTEENVTAGAHIAFDLNSWNNDSHLARANLFDYPAAIARILTGLERDFTPRGNAFPSVVVAYDRVAPSDGTARGLAGDTSDYDRLRFEASYKSPFATFGGKEYWVVAEYRRLIELSPSSMTEAADLDDYDFFSVSLESDDGIFLTYGSGRQPFDVADQDFAEIGWRFGF